MELLIPLLLFGVMYALFIVPQKRKLRAHQEMVARLGAGDEVMTTAGIYGTVRAVDGDVVRLEVAPGVELRLARGAIGQIVSADASRRAGSDGTGGLEPVADDATGDDTDLR